MAGPEWGRFLFRATLNRRLDARPEGEWGGRPAERQLILQLHQTREDVPAGGISIDANAPLDQVVDEILRLSSRPSA